LRQSAGVAGFLGQPRDVARYVRVGHVDGGDNASDDRGGGGDDRPAVTMRELVAHTKSRTMVIAIGGRLGWKRNAIKGGHAGVHAQPRRNAADVWCYPNASVKGRIRSAERVEAHPQSLSLAKRL
jgi:hypothetical protein